MLKLPPDFVAKVPFEIEPVVRILWLVGLMPVLSGVGHLLAGLLIRPDPPAPVEAAPLQIDATSPLESRLPFEAREREPIGRATPTSVTERTTNLLEH